MTFVFFFGFLLKEIYYPWLASVCFFFFFFFFLTLMIYCLIFEIFGQIEKTEISGAFF